ncbi:MAGUK p55 subfamily member 6, partial [Penaeus vannamei]
VQDTLEEGVGVVEPVSSGNVKLVNQVRLLCEASTSAPSQELADLLLRPHLLALLETHDTIADRRHTGDAGTSNGYNNGINGCHDNATFMPEENGYPVDAIRMVGLRKRPDEPLGLTVREDESGYLVIARIMAGGSIDRQGLLHVGDAICEVNGVEINSLQQLHEEVAKCRDSVTLKVLPALHDPPAPNQVTSTLHPDATRAICYMRALYSYDPTDDTLLPTCPSQQPQDIGLKFEKGDILQIVDQSDPNWWQAQVVGSGSKRTGLIPSQELEERRKAFVRQEYDYVHKIGICGTRISKRKKKLMFSTKKSTDYDQAELLLYEEVARMPPFMRKTLVLIGSHGVGRRTLKNRIIASDPSKFGTIIPHTSRPMRELEVDGKAYHFTTREAMEADVRQHRYLEYGEFSGNLYGTKLDSILSVIRSGKMCLLDCSPALFISIGSLSPFPPPPSTLPSSAHSPLSRFFHLLVLDSLLFILSLLLPIYLLGLPFEIVFFSLLTFLSQHSSLSFSSFILSLSSLLCHATSIHKLSNSLSLSLLSFSPPNIPISQKLKYR